MILSQSNENEMCIWVDENCERNNRKNCKIEFKIYYTINYYLILICETLPYLHN